MVDQHLVDAGLIPDDEVLGLHLLVGGHLLQQEEAVGGALVEGIELDHPLEHCSRLGFTAGLQLHQAQFDLRLRPRRLSANRLFQNLRRRLVLPLQGEVASHDRIRSRAAGRELIARGQRLSHRRLVVGERPAGGHEVPRRPESREPFGERGEDGQRIVRVVLDETRFGVQKDGKGVLGILPPQGADGDGGRAEVESVERKAPELVPRFRAARVEAQRFVNRGDRLRLVVLVDQQLRFGEGRRPVEPVELLAGSTQLLHHRLVVPRWLSFETSSDQHGAHRSGQIRRVVSCFESGDGALGGADGRLSVAKQLLRLGGDSNRGQRVVSLEQLQRRLHLTLAEERLGPCDRRNKGVAQRRIAEIPRLERNLSFVRGGEQVALVPHAMEDPSLTALLFGEPLGVDCGLRDRSQLEALGDERGLGVLCRRGRGYGQARQREQRRLHDVPSPSLAHDRVNCRRSARVVIDEERA